MARREPPQDPGIITARLDGTAHRLLREKAGVDECLVELHAITTDPRLLGLAAGQSLGAWCANRSYGSDRVARMLEAAGADLAVRDVQAAVVERRLLAGRGRNGIGHLS